MTAGLLTSSTNDLGKRVWNLHFFSHQYLYYNGTDTQKEWTMPSYATVHVQVFAAMSKNLGHPILYLQCQLV